MYFIRVFNKVLTLFLIIIIGYIGRKFKVLDGKIIKGLTGLMVNITLPALLVNSINQDFSPELLAGGIKMLLISVGVYGLSLIVALFAPYFLKTKNKEDLGVYQFMIMLSNVGFMGIPVLSAIFGEWVLFYVGIYNLPFNFVAFSIGLMMLNQGNTNGKFNPRLFLSPGVVSIFVGLILFAFNINLPEAIDGTLNLVGDTTTPLSMLVIGGMLAEVKMKETWSNWRIYIVSLVRLIILPLLVFIIIKPFAEDVYMLAIPVMVTAMPAASFVSVLADQYGGNAILGSQGVFLSTLFSVITIPLLALLFV
jgi:predicted permease